eukprot:10875842-Alexandrium_andersonii.AAC.1
MAPWLEEEKLRRSSSSTWMWLRAPGRPTGCIVLVQGLTGPGIGGGPGTCSGCFVSQPPSR